MINPNNAFSIVNVDVVPEDVSVIFCDVNDTVTKGDKLDITLAEFLVEIADNGVRVVFISGRDRTWLSANIRCPLLNMAKRMNLSVANIALYAELGLVSIDIATGTPTFHQGVYSSSWTFAPGRERIAPFFWQPKDLKVLKPGDQPQARHYIGFDANGLAYQIPMFPHQSTIFDDFIWSDTKEIIATAEAIRDPGLNVPVKTKQKIESAATTIKQILKYMGIQDVTVVPCGTAIDFIPNFNSMVFDKSWAVGMILEDLSKKSSRSVGDIAHMAMGIGDGINDIEFTNPLLSNGLRIALKMAFVGPSVLLGDTLNPNIFATANNGFCGPIATLEILKELAVSGALKPF